MTEKQFLDAVKEHRKGSKFFPCTKDIFDAHNIVRERVPVREDLMALPSTKPINRDNVNKLTSMVHNIRKNNPNISYSDAYKKAKSVI